MKAQWWLIGVVSAIALGGTGCGQSHGRAAPTAATRVRIINGMGSAEPAMHITQAATHHAVAAAIRIVSSAILPPGSRDVTRLPGSNLSQPSQMTACDPIVDATTLWLIRGSAGKLTAFLIHHLPPGMTNQGTGGLSSRGVTTSESVADIPRGTHSPQETLLFTFGPVGSATGLRVDALAVPSGALCTTS